MDLGLAGRRAIVCGASKGLGLACADSLAREGCEIILTARSADVLEAAAVGLRDRHGVTVTAVAADLTTAAGRERVLAACPAPDILVTNVGAPGTGTFAELDEATWRRAIDACLLMPVLMIRAVVDGMAERGFGRIVNISSNAVKQTKLELALSAATRLGLTGAVSGLARTVARHGVTINNLLPGPFATESFSGVVADLARQQGTTEEAQWAIRVATIPAGRVGRPEEFGDACAWICSAQAGFMTAQNILLDGGSYHGAL